MKMLFIILFAVVSTGLVQGQNYYIAHRGASYLAPENTLAAVELAWKSGADAVEIDIHLSADKRIMVIHDDDTKRTSGEKSSYTIKTTNSDILRSVDVGSFKSTEFKDEKIPFIEEIIATVPPGKELYVEIKTGPEILPELQKVVKESGKAKQMVFICFDWETILRAQKLFPNNQCYYLKTLPFGLYDKMEEASKTKLTGISLYYKIIRSKLVEQANDFGLDVTAWTVDDPSEVVKLNEMGVSKITTNRPKWLKEQVDKLK